MLLLPLAAGEIALDAPATFVAAIITLEFVFVSFMKALRRFYAFNSLILWVFMCICGEQMEFLKMLKETPHFLCAVHLSNMS